MHDYPSMAEENKNWQAECDARTLAESAEVMADATRYEAAKAAAAKLAEDKMVEATAASKVAAGIVSYPSMKQETPQS